MRATSILSATAALLLLLLIAPLGLATTTEAPKGRQHQVFFAGTPQELNVYRIYGRQQGPTIMLIGGIQGDEPGGFLSADLYADVALTKGNLIVVPRANFSSIVKAHRGPSGDMNRKFGTPTAADPDRKIVGILKDLMGESDLLLNLHDGSGYYRPTWENNMANPKRYGQCIIADANTYTLSDGRTIDLKDIAQKVVDRVNEKISNPLYKFNFHNTNTGAANSKHKEQRGSATYYALTKVGIPAYGVETSKQLPSLEMKIYQHNLAINAFMDIFGVEIEFPPMNTDSPNLDYAVILINENLPLAVSDGQSVEINEGDTIKVLHIVSNFKRGLSADVQGVGSYNDVGQSLTIQKPTSIILKKDNTHLGQIKVSLKSTKAKGDNATPGIVATNVPRLLGPSKIITKSSAQGEQPKEGTLVGTLVPKEGETKVATPLIATPTVTTILTGKLTDIQDTEDTEDAEDIQTKSIETSTPPENPIQTDKSPRPIMVFVLEVNGQTVEVNPEQTLEVLDGSLVKMVGIKSKKKLPTGLYMNLRGFVPASKRQDNNGNDLGFTANTSQLMPEFSQKQRGFIYKINAELGRRILASCNLKLVKPALASVTFELNGQTHTLKVGHGQYVPVGAKVTVLSVELVHGQTMTQPSFTLGGKPFPSDLPQVITMPSFNANLAVFNGKSLAGKVTWWAKQ